MMAFQRLGPTPRRGSIIPMLAVCVVALFGFVALAIDLGMLMVARTECQNAADAAALVGVRTLDNRVPAGVHPDSYDNQKDSAEANARAAIQANVFLNTNFTSARIENVSVGLYDYNADTNQFNADFTNAAKPIGKSWSAVTVRVNGDQPSYFGRVLGIATMPTSARAVAVHRPRDIALVLDFTGSMGYSTTFTRNNVHLNSDPSYPQFSHYERYLAYQTTNSSASQTQTNASNRPNPLYHTGVEVAAPYVYSPGNFNIQNENGPPIAGDFYYDPANLSDWSVAVTNVNANNLTRAFMSTTFSSTTRSSLGVGPTPAPDNFKDQTDSPVSFTVNGGDRWPRKRGFISTTGANWAPNTSTGAAITAAEFLGWANNYSSGSSLPSPSYPSGRSQSNFRDAAWERYGYDLDVADYVSNRGSSWDPRWDWNIASSSWQHSRPGSWSTTNSFRPRLKPVAERFKGYTMGPGQWGKTFFIWPPDPRADKDWRRLYFMKYDNNDFQTQGSGSTIDNDTRTSGTQSINGALLTDGTGSTLRPYTGSSNTYNVNYEAILAWIKSGPPVLPPNLRSGRVLYYSSIPDDVNVNVGSTDQRMDKRFWRAYIDYVLNGSTGNVMAGVENRGWPEGVTPSIFTGELLAYDVDGSGNLSPDPRPYMAYTDNPSRPRMHMWFGPLTMMGFINWKKMLSGTSHEAQCWQLKAGVNSALDDIKANHPNDLVGLSFFSYGDYDTPMVAMGQAWQDLKNALFYPKSLLNVVDTDLTAELRPYNTSVSYTGDGNIPNAQGNTDPNTGLAHAFNLLSPSQYTNANPARRGRRGASKIVIFETDGVPNSARRATLVRRGYDTYYSPVGGAAHPSYSNNTSGGSNAAYEIINQMVKPMASNNSNNVDSGLSMPSARCRVYSIGFGDIFSTSAGPAAAGFLLEIQKRGGTSNAGPVPAADTAIPADQIITGTFDTRIENLRTALERILQSGVQVTLIE